MAFDYIPDGMMVQNGKLVPKPPDPYVEIERLKLKLADLQRRIDMGENAEQAAGLQDLREKLGALEKENRSLQKQADGAKKWGEEQAAKCDELENVVFELKHQVAEFEKLPPATSTIEELAKANQKIAKLEADLSAAVAASADAEEKATAKEKELLAECVLLRDKVKKANNALASAEAKTENLQTQLEHATRGAMLEKSDLEFKLGDMQNQNGCLIEEKAKLVEQVAYWKDKANELEGGVKKTSKKG